MKNPKNLTLKQKKFLQEQGLNPNEYKVIVAPADHYIFYHVETGIEVTIRRWCVDYVDNVVIRGAIALRINLYVISAALNVAL